MTGLRVVLAATITLNGTALIGARAWQAPPRSARDGVYTADQAGSGKALYDAQCASCHGSMASVMPDMAPLLNDPGFQNLWRERSLARLFGRIQETMPQDKPGSLSPKQTVDLIAYVLSANSLPAGDVALTADLEALKEIRLDTGEP